MSRPDWGRVKLVYIQGEYDKATGESRDLSLREVARICNVSYPAVQQHAKKEDWKSERAEYKRERDEQVKARLLRMGIKDMVSLQVQNIAASLATVTEYVRQLRDPEKQKNITAFEVLQHQKYLDERIEEITGIEEERTGLKPDSVLDFTFGEIVEAGIKMAREGK